jgi:hypothetical protein
MKKPDKIHLLIHGYKSLGKKSLAEEFLQILKDAGEIYLPSKIGMYEPIKTPYSVEDTIKLWVESEKEMNYGGSVMMTGSNQLSWSIDWKLDGSNSVSLWIATKSAIAKKGTEHLVALAKQLFIWANGVYGYGCHISQIHYTPGLNYRICLGGLSWMALFGDPYVKMFGKDVILTAPCKVEEFAENRFMLLTSDEPIDETPELIAVQEKVKKHLGEEVFYREEPPRQTPLTMEDLLAGKNKPSKEGYRSPDLSAYIKDSGITKDEGLIAKVNDDGTIATYKVKPEKN